MIETYEFRVYEEHARRLFGDSEGKRLGLGDIRLIRINATDPRLKAIERLHGELRLRSGRGFFAGWDIMRRYTPRELDGAALLHLEIHTTFEPAGEECGTSYDESSACPRCGAGARRRGPLILDEKRIPKGKDVARTIAGEVVVSDRFRILAEKADLTGVRFQPLRSKQAAGGMLSHTWHGLEAVHACAEIVPPTRVANNPFDEDPLGEYRCPEGHLLGLNLLSPLWVNLVRCPAADLLSTRQYIGTRRGLLRPERVLVASQRFRAMVAEHGLKGFRFEPAEIQSAAEAQSSPTRNDVQRGEVR
jgi:hypothetical protein